MTASRLTPRPRALAATVLAALLAHGAVVVAADPAPVTPLRQVASIPESPVCGTDDERLRLRSRLASEDSWDFCRFDLERVDIDGNVLSTAPVAAKRRCAPHWILCDETGGGVIVMADGDQAEEFELQRFDAGGALVGAASVAHADPRCHRPHFVTLARDGDVLLLDACQATDGPAGIALRRLPAEGGVEREPLWVRAPSAVWATSMGVAEDPLGHALVTWNELYDEDPVTHQYKSRVMARGVSADGEVLGEPFQVDAAITPLTYLLRVDAAGDGLFSVSMWNWFAGGDLERTVSLDPDLYPAVPVTTTTLPPSPDAPDFDLVRTVGQSSLPPEGSSFSEGSLASLVGDGRGGLMLRRWLGATTSYEPWYDGDVPSTNVYRSSSAGVRWTRVADVPPVYRYQQTPPWDAGAPSGTLVAAEVIWEHDHYEDGEWWGTVGNVVARRSVDGGATWSEPARIGLVACGDCDEFAFHEVALAGDGNGHWIAATVTSDRIAIGSPDTYRTTIEVSWSDDDARSWSPGRRVWSGADAVEYDAYERTRLLTTAVAGRDGSWALVWRSESRGMVWTAHAAAAGGDWVVTNHRGPAEPPPWTDSWEGEWYDSRGPYSRAALATAGAGAWVVAWEEKYPPAKFGSDGDIFFARSQDGGATWSAPEPLNAYAATDGASDQEPALASDADGRLLAVWSSHDPLGGACGEDSDIVSSISLDAGRTWSPPAIVDPAAVGDDRQDLAPLVAATGDGRWTVAWTTLPMSARWRWETQDASVRVAIAGSTCGDGALDPGEECDDGNDADLDGCNANCTVPGCRNEVLDAGESCEHDDPGSGLGCASDCEPVVCGDAERDPWTEQCDDGNADDTDECTSSCRRPVCGDGFIYLPWEECDDANTSDDDSCRNDCKAAYCGDGVVSGDEACDDGDGWGGNSCTDECRPATCGDGRVWLGIEQCDDPDGSELGGNCTADCRFVEPCGDADASGQTTAADSLRILRTAIDLEKVCPPDRCDVNGNGAITSIDASGALRTSAGLDVTLACPAVGMASLVLDASPLLTALQVEVDYSGSDLAFGLGDGKSHCEFGVPNAMYADAIVPPGVLSFGVISLQGFRGPVVLLRCPVYARRGPVAEARPVEIRIVDQMGEDDSPVWPPPRVRLVTD